MPNCGQFLPGEFCDMRPGVLLVQEGLLSEPACINEFTQGTVGNLQNKCQFMGKLASFTSLFGKTL